MSEKTDRRRKWTPEQEQMIRDRYPTLGAKKLAAQMGVDPNKLEGKAFQMGVKFNRIDWTPELEEEIRRCYVSEGPKKLAARLRIHRDGLVAKARRMGVESTRKCPPKNFIWTKEMLAAVKDRYVAEGPDKLAEEFGVAIGTIRRVAVRQFGLHTIAGHAIAGRKRALASASCDIHYFDQWTPNGAWILGFLFADGCVNKKFHSVSVVQSRKDEYAVEFIKRELKSNHPIRISTDDKGREYVTLSVSSTILVERLMELGLKPRKTYNDYPFPEIPDDMAPHFARGCIDGDGHISISDKGVCTIGFVGPPKFVEGFRDMLVRLAGMTNKVIRHCNKQGNTPLHSICWSSLSDINAYHRFAYPKDFGFCLKRKYDNLIKWLSRARYARGHYFGNGKPRRENIEDYKPWTDSEREYIIKNYNTSSINELISILHRSSDAIKSQARKLGVRESRSKDRWSRTELIVLRGNYTNLGPVEVGKLLKHKTQEMIIEKAERLGLVYQRKQ